jgi:hypothetical protein
MRYYAGFMEQSKKVSFNFLFAFALTNAEKAFVLHYKGYI